MGKLKYENEREQKQSTDPAAKSRPRLLPDADRKRAIKEMLILVASGRVTPEGVGQVVVRRYQPEIRQAIADGWSPAEIGVALADLLTDMLGGATHGQEDA